jgi:aromatic-amino-acid transaminase
MEFRMVAEHSARENAEDTIFKISGEAQRAAQRLGSGNIINATVGTILEDSGRLAVLPTVTEILRNLDAADYAAYAPLAGLPDYLEASKKAAFRDFMPEGFIEAVATPGGTGAIRHTIWNYSNLGDSILTADWHWGPYKTIAEEHGRRIEAFTLFDEEYKFYLERFKKAAERILKQQKRLIVLFNFPANNPTGYNPSKEEWTELLSLLKDFSSDSGNRIILFVDIAYIDYCLGSCGSREFMSGFSALGENILVIMGFSMSKGYTLYGMRCGSMIGISSSSSVIREFRSVNEFSNRGVWSSGTRPAMVVLSKIFSDSSLFERTEAERSRLRDLLEARAKAFMREAQNSGLFTCPYMSGFFISVPCNNSYQTVENLKEENIFAVPMEKGIRFAVCSVPEDKCAIAPHAIKKVLE